jgi:hypothetical protein
MSRGYSIFSKTVSTGIRLKSWKIKPMFFPLKIAELFPKLYVHPRYEKAGCRRLIETPDEIQQRRLTSQRPRKQRTRFYLKLAPPRAVTVTLLSGNLS